MSGRILTEETKQTESDGFDQIFKTLLHALWVRPQPTEISPTQQPHIASRKYPFWDNTFVNKDTVYI